LSQCRKTVDELWLERVQTAVRQVDARQSGDVDERRPTGVAKFAVLREFEASKSSQVDESGGVNHAQSTYPVQPQFPQPLIVSEATSLQNLDLVAAQVPDLDVRRVLYHVDRKSEQRVVVESNLVDPPETDKSAGVDVTYTIEAEIEDPQVRRIRFEARPVLVIRYGPAVWRRRGPATGAGERRIVENVDAVVAEIENLETP